MKRRILKKLCERHYTALTWIPDQSESILDVGCNNGYFLSIIKPLFAYLAGTDVLPNEILFAKENHPGIEFRLSDGTTIPFKDKSFDVVTCLDVLEHAKNKNLLIKELYRVIKPGGMLILSVPQKGFAGLLDPDNLFFSKLSRLRRSIYKKQTDKYLDADYHWHYKLSDIGNYFADKFVIEKVYQGGTLLTPIFFFLAKFLDTIDIYAKRRLSRLLPFYGRIIAFFGWLKAIDYRVSIGKHSYNLVVQARKCSVSSK